MIEISESLVLLERVEEIYGWICEIDAYQHWMPYCQKSAIVRRHSEFKQDAYIEMGFGPFRERLLTHNTYFPCKKIEMDLLEGPFVFFKGEWILEPQIEGVRVSLEMKAQFRSRTLEKIVLNMAQVYRHKILESFRRHFFAKIIK